MSERKRFEAWCRETHSLPCEHKWIGWQAALSAPPGYVLVPVEPTPEMLMAAVRSREGPAVYNVTSAKGLSVLESDAEDDYRAMIAAAPKEPTT